MCKVYCTYVQGILYICARYIVHILEIRYTSLEVPQKILNYSDYCFYGYHFREQLWMGVLEYWENTKGKQSGTTCILQL